MAQSSSKKQPTQKALLAEVEQLRQELEELQQEKEDLEMMLEMNLEHADTVEEELHTKAEEALRRSEQQLRMIVEATPAPVIISEAKSGKIVYANTMTGPFLGTSTEELLGKRTFTFYKDPADLRHVLAILAEQGEVSHHELQLKTIDGHPIWVEVALRSLEFNDKPSILATFHDISHLKAMNEASNRFVPQEYLGFLEKESIINIALGDYVTGEMTVMFSDLRGFTTVSETMTPQENFDFINAYLGRVSPAIRQYHGFIIKYLGDGIHAIFPRSADDGVQAGIDKLEQVNAYNEYRQSKDRLPIAIGIGVNTGYMMVGMVGEKHRVQGDAFSDDVNLTARLEGLTKFYGISFIISQATYDRLADPTRYNIRYLDKVQVKGRTNALDLYEVYDADLPKMKKLKQDTQAEYEAALDLYYNREFDAAQAKLFRVLQRNPRDKVAWHHLVNATQLADNGAPEGWTGVTVMTQK